MRLTTEAAGLLMVAIAIFAHAWVARVQAKPPVVNAVGWIVVTITALIFGSHFLHCG
jgi:hypothetical protein